MSQPGPERSKVLLDVTIHHHPHPVLAVTVAEPYPSSRDSDPPANARGDTVGACHRLSHSVMLPAGPGVTVLYIGATISMLESHRCTGA
jgi:hypothetical protein